MLQVMIAEAIEHRATNLIIVFSPFESNGALEARRYCDVASEGLLGFFHVLPCPSKTACRGGP
jgi:hypothetical protein